VFAQSRNGDEVKREKPRHMLSATEVMHNRIMEMQRRALERAARQAVQEQEVVGAERTHLHTRNIFKFHTNIFSMRRNKRRRKVCQEQVKRWWVLNGHIYTYKTFSNFTNIFFFSPFTFHQIYFQ
jgi:hypothetical protein